MQTLQQFKQQEDNDLKKLFYLFLRNFTLFAICVTLAVSLTYLKNRYSINIYRITSSMLIIDESSSSSSNDINDYLNSNLLGINQNFENELWVLRSSPVIEEMIRNLDLYISYFRKQNYQYVDAYKEAPFKVLMLYDHVQPIHEYINIIFTDSAHFKISIKAKNINFKHFKENELAFFKDKWDFQMEGKFGELIQTPEMAFIVQLDSTRLNQIRPDVSYRFIFADIASLTNSYKQQIQFNVVQQDATVIELAYRTSSIKKGTDILNELMEVYSQQNLDRKNYIANITIDYIDSQLSEISDSLSQADSNLQSFRSSRQLLNLTEQASDLSATYRNLQNQLAELTTRKRYYDYVSDYIENNDDFTEMIVPAAMGIQDQVLNNLVAELVSLQNQLSNLIQNQQEKNPLVQQLNIQIESTVRTITGNISAVLKTTELSIEEMNKRIRSIESDIRRVPRTQSQLGGIERKYRLNDAIYNYLLQKRAEAKITQASNLPDNIILEPAKMAGNSPVSPNRRKNYMVAFVLGVAIPFGYLFGKSIVNNKIVSQDKLEQLSDAPIMGKIMHNRRKSSNVVFEYPNSAIAESYRALRTNIEFFSKTKDSKVILVTSCVQGEGKSFNALNLSMSYAQFDQPTVLLDMDLHKQTSYFSNIEKPIAGVSMYLSEKQQLDDVIFPSPYNGLDYVPVGPLPPNPARLLSLDKTKELIKLLRERYSCIVIDTSPLAQVSDAYMLMNLADVKLIIARYNFTKRKIFSMLMQDLKNKKIENTCVLLNDNKIYKDQYGYGYGYKSSKKRK